MELFNAGFCSNYLKNKRVFLKGRRVLTTTCVCVCEHTVLTKYYHMLCLVRDVCCLLCPSNSFPFVAVSPSNQQMPGCPGPPESERRPGSGSGMRLQRSKPGMTFLIIRRAILQTSNAPSCWQDAAV